MPVFGLLTRLLTLLDSRTMLDTAPEIEDTRAARRQAMRSRILDAAWRLARRDGLGALSLRDIAREVGMRAPSLYTYFSSKHAIYDAMFAQGMREILKRIRTLDARGDIAQVLKRGLRDFMEFCTEDPVRYQLLFQRTIPGFEPSPETYAISVEALDLERRFLEEAGIRGPRALDLWTAIGAGLTSQQISNDPGGHRWVRLIDESVGMFLAQVRKGGRR